MGTSQNRYCKNVPDLLGFHPMKYESRRIIALLLLFVAISGIVMSFSEDVLCAGELPGAHEAANTSHEHDTAQISNCNCCPSAPSSSHTSSDHLCIGDCNCPCHAPLPSTTVSFSFSQAFSFLYHAEPFRYIPKVYISLFIPPDAATI